MSLKVTHLFEYPLKSSRGRSLEKGEVGPFGMRDDRRFALIDDNDRVVTGREHPIILLIASEIRDRTLYLTGPTGERLAVPFDNGGTEISVRLFGKTVHGTLMDSISSKWLSELLANSVRLIHILNYADTAPEGVSRNSFVDSAPLHLISLATLDFLNLRLERSVGVENFRPNIVVDGNLPFEEDHWTQLTVNGCRLRVKEMTLRCVLTTVDPWSGLKDVEVEPLATLARIRRPDRGPITFGIDLSPVCNGLLGIGDSVLIE